MGAKQSISKKEAEKVSTVEKVPGRPHDYEEIDDDALIDNQTKFKNSPQVSRSEDNNIHTGAAPTESSVVIISVGSRDSPRSIQRYHPVDEVANNQLEQKVASETKDTKSKQKVGSNEKFGKGKGKELQKDLELLGYQKTSESTQRKTSLTDSKKSTINDNLEEQHLATNADDKTDVKNKKKGQKLKIEKNKKKVQSKMDETTTRNADSDTTLTSITKPRYQSYEEISDEQLTSNMEALKLKNDEHNKTNSPKMNAGKQQQNVTKEVDRVNSSPSRESKLIQGTESPNVNSRYHPYDEITNEELYSNRKLFNIDINKKKEKSVEKVGNKEDFEQTEYLNVAAIEAATSMTSLTDKTAPHDVAYDDNIRDLYAVPHKTRTKENKSKSLNYIEVEFSTTSTNPEVKISSSRTIYSNIAKQGDKIVLLES